MFDTCKKGIFFSSCGLLAIVAVVSFGEGEYWLCSNSWPAGFLSHNGMRGYLLRESVALNIYFSLDSMKAITSDVF